MRLVMAGGLIPPIGAHATPREPSPASSMRLILQQFVGVARESSRGNINKLGLEPFLNIGLPKQLYVNSSPKMTCDLSSKERFAPLDLVMTPASQATLCPDFNS